MSDLADPPPIVIQPRHIARESFWCDAPRERFTDYCRTRVFADDRSERQQRKAAGIAAELEMTA